MNDEETYKITEEDIIELGDRFGDFVEFVVRDMVSGKGERWQNDRPNYRKNTE